VCRSVFCEDHVRVPLVNVVDVDDSCH
jgi:hypothetical protein